MDPELSRSDFMGVPVALIELTILVIVVACFVGGLFVARMLRNSK
jgi:hypothetical protein